MVTAQRQLESTGVRLPDGGDVHLWSFPLEFTGTQSRAGTRLLPAIERERAGRIGSANGRARFVASRVALRSILAGILGVGPIDVAIETSKFGKPHLAKGTHPDLRFSMAHSGDLGVVAVSFAREIGVDIERVRHDVSFDGIVRLCFSARETAELETLPRGERLTAFLAGWTRKEAFLKAMGSGMSHPMRAVEVTLSPYESPRIVSVDGNSEAGARWSLRALDGLPAAYIGALVVEGVVGNVLYDEWLASRV